jgi:ribosomal protein S18 acetylase RimI-like enzyme
MEALCFRLASEADLPFLVELRQATMAPHEAASGLVRSPEQSIQRVRASFEVAQIILLAGQPVGLLKVLRHGPEWELLQIQLAPGVQGQGLGSHILQALLSEAKAAGVALRLGVLKENPARRLYERLGFAVVREKEYSYEMAAGT